jgi:hypothetical protein
VVTNGGNGGISAIWKTIALVLVTILLTGTPGIIYALRTWTVSEDLKLVRDRQDNVRDRLAALEVEVADLEEDILRAQSELDQAYILINNHITNSP